MANFEIQVPIKLDISEETANLCAKVLEIYIQDKKKVVATLQFGPGNLRKYVRILDENDGEYEEADELQAQPDNKEETEEIGWQLSKLEQ